MLDQARSEANHRNPIESPTSNRVPFDSGNQTSFHSASDLDHLTRDVSRYLV